jgi:hypothetical protein
MMSINRIILSKHVNKSEGWFTEWLKNVLKGNLRPESSGTVTATDDDPTSSSSGDDDEGGIKIPIPEIQSRPF